jgi:hypothetical protein
MLEDGTALRPATLPPQFRDAFVQVNGTILPSGIEVSPDCVHIVKVAEDDMCAALGKGYIEGLFVDRGGKQQVRAKLFKACQLSYTRLHSLNKDAHKLIQFHENQRAGGKHVRLASIARNCAHKLLVQTQTQLSRSSNPVLKSGELPCVGARRPCFYRGCSSTFVRCSPQPNMLPLSPQRT